MQGKQPLGYDRDVCVMVLPGGSVNSGKKGAGSPVYRQIILWYSRVRHSRAFDRPKGGAKWALCCCYVHCVQIAAATTNTCSGVPVAGGTNDWAAANTTADFTPTLLPPTHSAQVFDEHQLPAWLQVRQQCKYVSPLGTGGRPTLVGRSRLVWHAAS